MVLILNIFFKSEYIKEELKKLIFLTFVSHSSKLVIIT